MSTAGASTRRFSAGLATFSVACPNATVRDAVEDLFVDLEDGREDVASEEFVVASADDPALTVSWSDGTQSRPLPPNEALATLVTLVSRLSLDADPARLHLHCAALSQNSRGVLISAASGTGKTTLAASLAHRGWSYLSDEAVALESDGLVATGFAKPLMIKPGGGSLVPELEDHRVSLEPDDGSWWHIPASRVSGTPLNRMTPTVIVNLFRDADGRVDLERESIPLHPVDAVVGLMGQTLDPERFGPDAVVVLATAAARCHCVAMAVGPLAHTARVLEGLLSEPPPHRSVQLIERRENGAAPAWTIPDSVRAVQIDDRSVVHNSNGGLIVALDEPATGVWLAISGHPPPWWEPAMLMSAATQRFLAELAEHGLLQHRTF